MGCTKHPTAFYNIGLLVALASHLHTRTCAEVKELHLVAKGTGSTGHSGEGVVKAVDARGSPLVSRSEDVYGGGVRGVGVLEREGAAGGVEHGIGALPAHWYQSSLGDLKQGAVSGQLYAPLHYILNTAADHKIT